ncbi:MAG TPA: hypothetical protein DDZ80_27105 [Cyanobacteria bacterium UBA8803]|nr:hypothetical protein [Cyanobacteria bacterium UBA8803]
MSKQSSPECNPSHRKSHFPSVWKFCVSQLTTAGLIALAIPSHPATAGVDQFQICAAELLRADVSREVASRVCGEALYPKDLSLCVLKIRDLTPIAANEALNACRRVRRPRELASCVVNINKYTPDPEALSVLDHCRRSLLPLRFAECAIGLSREIDFSPARALETCIAAEDFTR